jgi:hypothetical protein
MHTAIDFAAPGAMRLSVEQTPMSYLGLAPFLRKSIAGIDLRLVARDLLIQAQAEPGDANLWMNLAIAMMCLGERAAGLKIQAQALRTQRVFSLPAISQPAKLRLLMLMTPGDIAANTPVECLLENSDIDLIHYYLTPGAPLAVPVPEHDVALVAVCAADDNRKLLQQLERALAAWPKPIVNLPQFIPATDRDSASRLLQNLSGLLMPPTLRASRRALTSIAAGAVRLADLFEGCDFPAIVRPVGSHAGKDLEKITRAEELAVYLDKVGDEQFFVSRFIDYRSADGQFRKYRIALIDGEAYACHMGVSEHWMIHYLNAGMYANAAKREEEAQFMANFGDFAARHRVALAAIHRRTQLDYVCIDCAESPGGELLVFEIDHCAVVHAMDSEDLFPFKQTAMRKARDAFRGFLLRLQNGESRRLAA